MLFMKYDVFITKKKTWESVHKNGNRRALGCKHQHYTVLNDKRVRLMFATVGAIVTISS